MYAHVFPLMHHFTINKHLVGANSVADRISWIRSCGDLDFSPLAICRHKFALVCEVFEFFEDALFLNTAFSLDKW